MDMKKSFGIYSIIWAICLAVFNVIVFVTPNEIDGVSKFDGLFWVAYAFITVAFLVQLPCAFFAFKAANLKKFFYNTSLLAVSYGGLVAMLIAGSVFTAIPSFPTYVGIIVCTVILAIQVIGVIKAASAAAIVSGIDEKIERQTSFIKCLTMNAERLASSATSDELCAEAKKVYEAIRYSDPMADSALTDLDSQIERQFSAFADAIKKEDCELARETATVFCELIEKRNQNCKLLKQN